ncbi:MAG: formate dehydrogenase subunit gamma [Proteobacteria bacterium]|nr:formate dehydrogenase subunit gamma [Pseudomonadota bacterium]
MKPAFLKRMFNVSLFLVGSLGHVSGETPPSARNITDTPFYIDVQKDSYLGVVGNWKNLGQDFINWQSNYNLSAYVLILGLIIGVLSIHYLIFGRTQIKKITHGGKLVPWFSLFNRVVHWLAAVSMSILVLTGLHITFGNVFGGGGFMRFTRDLHVIFGLFFILPAVLMFIMWVKNAIIAGYDFKWLFRMGGYLERDPIHLPQGKFNAGQKIWFWEGTVGGAVMFYTGYLMYSFEATTDNLRISAIVHNVLGVAIIVFFILHIYMVIFIHKYSMRSMISGKKDEIVATELHSEYMKKVKEQTESVAEG